MKSIFILPILFLSISSFAAPTVTNVTGVSNFEAAVSGGTAAAAYGGIAGTCTTTSSTSTCDSCVDATTPIKACNPKSVHSGLTVTVSFTTAVAVSNVRVELLTEAGAGPSLQPLNNTTLSAAAGGSGSITTTWSAICGQDTALTTSCVGSAAGDATFATTTRALVVWVDENNNGTAEESEKGRIPLKFQYIDTATSTKNTQSYQTSCSGTKGMCGFEIKPGDSKLYVDQFNISDDGSGKPVNDTNAPDWLGVAFISLAGSAVTPANVANNSSTPIIKAYDSDYGIADSSLDGFENYQRYCIAGGNINKAYNILYFTSPTADATKTCASPSEVVGLLDDKKCFISTAAFGSEMAPEVETFRKFRNQFLLTNQYGKEFVKMYYKYSPPFANFIAKNESLRAAVRFFLYPLLAFSTVALQYGILIALLTAMVCFILLNAVLKTVFKNKKVIASIAVILLITFAAKADIEPNAQKVKHPGAAQGLVRIKKDGTYVYDVKKDTKKDSGHLYFGQANNPDVTIEIDAVDSNGNPTGGVNQYDFDDFYANSSKFIIGYDYEWYPWAEKTMLGLQMGAGFMYAEGHGRLKTGSGAEPNPVAEEKFNFLTLPLNLGAVYRFQYKDTQFLVPYVAGGGTYVVLAEKREDKNTPNFTGGAGFYGAGGVLVNLTNFDSETAFQLNSEYGIGNLWFSLEFKTTQVEAESFQFSTQYVNAGFAFDF